MAIKRMINTRNPAEFREFQVRMTTVGKIRLGVFVGEGRGRPQKIDTFRLTSTDGELIRVAGELYGGTPREWKPQGGGLAQWEVITEANALPVYVVNGQHIDPVYEAWGGGRTCLRRCDGEWNKQTQEACVCNGPRPPAAKDLCKITTRVLLMLQEIPGLGSWMLETHGENAAAELSMPAQLVAAAPMPVPAMLRLRQEKRRNYSQEKKGFESLSFYVPWLDINLLTSQQIGVGGDALTRALVAAGAPAAIGSGDLSRDILTQGRAAIEGPSQAPPVAVAGDRAAPQQLASSPVVAPAPSVEIDETERARILVAIENADLAGLDKIKDAMIERNIRDKAVQDAWVSRHTGWLAGQPPRTASPATIEAAKPNMVPSPERRPPTRAEAAWRPPGVDGDGFEDRTIERPDDPATGADAWPHERKEYAEAVRRGATDQEIRAEGGPMHWLAGYDQARIYTAHEAAGAPEPDHEYRVGDTVTVGGLEFTKISNNPFELGSDAAKIFGAGHEVVDAEVIEDPAGVDYAALQEAADVADAAAPGLGPVGSVDDEYSAIFTLAGAPGREWTTAQTNDAIKAFAGVAKVGDATAEQLRALRVKMTEESTWAPSA